MCKCSHIAVMCAHLIGACVRPRLVMLEYRGDPSSDDTIALVGKGITFDTGGLNLKPTGFIEDMVTQCLQSG